MPERAVHDLNSELPARLIAVLGMHRSGTSYLAGSLQEAGLILGDCHTWNKHNEKGKGQLILKYNSLDELDGILNHIK